MIIAAPRPNATLLLLFGRLPEPGRTKTRLIPALGAAGAAAAARQLTARAVAAAEATGLDWLFCLAEGEPAAAQAWLGPQVQVALQAGGDVGARMADAFRRAFAAGWARVVLIGTDLPGLDAGQILAADAALRSGSDLVLGPALDGGYGLIALAVHRPELFSGIAWSTADVLAQTLAAAARAQLRVHTLAPIADVDTPADWQAFRERHPPQLSVIIPTLNEAAQLPVTLDTLHAHSGAIAVEVIVADGGSQDATVALAQAAGARVVQARGRGAQLNAGAAEARAPLLLFLHADTRVPPGFADEVLRLLAQAPVALAAFRLRIDAPHRAARLIAWGANQRSRWLGLPYGDQGLALRRATFERLGGFPALPILEDYALVTSARQLGRVVLSPLAVTTSARRWQTLGAMRVWTINQAMLIGYHLGMSPDRLARFYRRQGRR